jgi:hypothetical protein
MLARSIRLVSLQGRTPATSEFGLDIATRNRREPGFLCSFAGSESQMSSITQESLELLKRALSSPDDALAKSISTATGLVAYDLQAPAKNLYPFVTPIRNAMPRVGGGIGTATNWRQVNAIIGSGFDAMGWVPEGQRSGQMSYSTSSKSATFVTIGEEDAASS